MSEILGFVKQAGVIINGVMTAIGAVTAVIGVSLPILGRSETKAIGRIVGKLLKAIAKAGQRKKIDRIARTADDFLDGLISGLK